VNVGSADFIGFAAAGVWPRVWLGLSATTHE
jgi:hypothetical protein